MPELGKYNQRERWGANRPRTSHMVRTDRPPGGEGLATAPQDGSSPWANADWWTTPDLKFYEDAVAGGPGQYRDDLATFELPAWASAGGQFVTPRAFYGEYWAQPEDLRGAWVSQLQGDYSAQQATLAKQTAAQELLQGGIAQLQEGQTQWEGDPYRRAVLEGLASELETPVFSDVERAAGMNEIAQAVARNLAITGAEAAGRGVPGGGAAGGVRAGIRSGGEASGLQLGALMTAANREGRTRGLGTLARTAGAYEQLDRSYLDAIASLKQQQALLEAGVQFAPTDFYAFRDVAFQREAYEKSLQAEQEALAAWEKAQRLDVMDFLNFAANTFDALAPP
jgi:hypothetical protein